ncbi:MAG: hypothetical protein JSW65_07965, partial [Candidatus Bipolaricaulota bacterium]
VITDPHYVETPASEEHGFAPGHLGDSVERFRRALNAVRFVRRFLQEHGPAVAQFRHTHRGSSREVDGEAVLQVVRSACWNHAREPIGLLQVRITPDAVFFREVITGRYI